MDGTAPRIVLRTERLILREMTEADAPAVYRLHTDPDVMRYTGEPPPASVEEVLAGTRDRIVPSYREYGYGRWAVERAAVSELIGWSGLKYLPELDEVDVGYRFFTEHWGQGLATEAARAAVAHGLGALGLPRIIGLALRENAASIRVLEKAGLRYVNVIEYLGEEALRYVIDADAP